MIKKPATLATVAALMASALPAPALAADWVFVGVGAGNYNQFYIDRGSIRTMPNGYKRAWKRTIMGLPDENGDTSSLLFEEYDCNGGRSRIIHLTYFKDEKVTVNGAASGKWSFIAPESNGESFLNFVCYGKRPR